MRAAGFPETVSISPNDWPSECSQPHPGDLSAFMPQGIGMGQPLIVTPWGGPPQQSFYNFQAPSLHPFHNAPRADARGGTLYFDADATREALLASLSLIAQPHSKDYVAYVDQASDIQRDGYLDQMRFISFFALTFQYRVRSASMPGLQAASLGEAVWAFIEAQRLKWHNRALDGVAGGDGDNYETLAFGFCVENSYNGVWRVWSRARIVTK